MEEKLYFKPESYGKKKAPKEKKEKSEKKDRKILKLFLVLGIIIVIILIILWLLRGKTTISGQYPENVKNESLDCSAKNIVYDKVGSAYSDSTELKLTAVFNGTESLSTLSLKYTLFYANHAAASYGEASATTNLHEKIAEYIDSYSAFNNKVTLLDNTVLVTLHGTKNELKNDIAKQFFLVDRTENPTSLADYRKNYESLGLTCESSLDK